MSHRFEGERLWKGFGGLIAVSDVSLGVSSGAIMGLVGPNGAGKTTLFNLLAGAIVPDAGRVLLDGVDVTGKRPVAMARLGVSRTYQEARTFASLTVLENVIVHLGARDSETSLLVRRWGAGGRRDLIRRAMKKLDQIGLAEHANERAGDLPFGLQRMLSVARATAGDPVALLLDEPFAGLGEHEVATLTKLVRELATDGLAIMLIDHNIDEVANLCDEMLVLDQGSVLSQGTSAEVLEDEAVLRAYMGVE